MTRHPLLRHRTAQVPRGILFMMAGLSDLFLVIILAVFLWDGTLVLTTVLAIIALAGLGLMLAGLLLLLRDA